MTKKIIDADRVERMSFGLSLEEPVRVLEQVLPDRNATRFDMHYILEAGIVISGKVQRIYDKHEMTVGPGQVWLNGVWEPHGFTVRKAPCRLLMVLIAPEFLAELRCGEEPGFNWSSVFTIPPAKRPQVKKGDERMILDLAGRLHECALKKVPHRKLWLRTLVMELLLYLNRERRPRGRKKDAFGSFSTINPAVKLVFEQPNYITEETAARACAMSRNRFNILFKELMGIAFAPFALRHRLSRVACQLATTDEPIKAIAGQWGFADLSHMYRQFKRAYGLNPSQYRNKSA